MQYAILAYGTDTDFESRDDPARAPAYWDAWSAYVAAINESGLLVSAGGLQPPATATSISLRGGTRDVQDGPYPDTKEHLGGFFVIDVPDLDAAMAWAARCPSARSAGVEVRPLLPPR